MKSIDNNTFKNKYRVSSSRIQNYDYNQNWSYFITICTKNRFPFLWKLTPGQNHDELNKLVLSQLWKIAQTLWQDIPFHFPFITLWEYIIMPNHIHGVIHINKEAENSSETGSNINHWKPWVLGVIIGRFKWACTLECRKLFPSFSWQPRFYEHIIRSEEELARISEYIIGNPQNWEKDEYFS
jgi:REP element-mobilizing transposase RayT